MSETLAQRIRETLDELRRTRPTHAPTVHRDGYHVIVGDSRDPLRDDFVSSGKKREEPREIAMPD